MTVTYVVLVNPEGPENIGATARAMMNMDCAGLILVHPACDHLSASALNYAIHAKKILEDAKIVLTLESALRYADISVAVSRRIGQWRKRDYLAEELAKFLIDYQDKNVYLVFGREKTGLTNEELQSCDITCSIPSSADFPSLNLAQSVMVVLYEIFKTKPHKYGENEMVSDIAPRVEFDGMLNQMIRSFDEMDFFKNVPEWRLKNYIKKVLIRSKLDRYDVLVINNLFTRLQGVIKRLKKESGKKI
jgi:tRNA/rRNA methyltransferase